MPQEQHTYRPRFKSEQIQSSTVIGAITDYTPYYRLLKSNIFSFYHHTDELPTISIDQYISHSRMLDITVNGQVKYNNQRLAINMKLNHFPDNIKATRKYLFEVMYEMKYQLKLAMYDLSPFKEQMDIIYNNLMENLHSTNGNHQLMDYFQKILEELDERANHELEREIMGNNIDTAFDDVGFLPSAKGVEMPLEIDNDEFFNTTEGDTSQGQSLRDFVEETIEPPKEKTAEELAQEEEDEYNRIENFIIDGASTLRLNRRTIFKLSKERTNKFVLPLEAGKKDDIDKFIHLTKQPFSFLNYNDAMFSVNLNTGLNTMWNEDKDESAWNGLAQQSHSALNSVATRIASKKDKIIERRKRLNKANNKLDEQIEYLKEQFEKKAEKFQHSAYVKFIATRTANNIQTIREAQSYSKRVEKALKNKRLIKNPIAFFERALCLYLGDTGRDIIRDLETLGFTSRGDAELGIKYLLFLLKLVEKREDELIAPIITITDLETFGVGYEQADMVKVMAGHMFIHTVTIHQDYEVNTEPSPPIPPSARYIQEYIDNGMTMGEVQQSYPELFI